MNIDSHITQSSLAYAPARPEPVKPGQETPRPVPTSNGAEAGARKPLQDDQRARDTAGESRNRADGNQQGAARAGARAGVEPELSETQKRQLEQLEARDREVRAHEAAHKAAAGQHARGAASYDYQTGPDGRRYAVGGEVSIDTSRTGNPEKDLAKAQTIRAAALAPASPSAQDRRVASEATAMEARAQAEIREAERAEPAEASEEPANAAATGVAPAAETEDNEQGLAANDAYNPDAPVRAVPRATPAPVGDLLDVFA